MRFRSPRSRFVRAFTLIELLVVLAIMTVLIAGVALSLQGTNNSGKFNKAVAEVSGILGQARAYAAAQNTYVWVVLYQNIPANNGPLEVYVGAFASNDGTDPFSWAGSVILPSPGTVGNTGTALTQIIHTYHEKGLSLETSTLPNAPGNPNLPATGTAIPNFQYTAQSDSGPVALSNASPVYWLIQFTPTGAARNGSTSVDSIWFGLQPSLSHTALDSHNIASVKVNGLTGITAVYRQ